MDDFFDRPLNKAEMALEFEDAVAFDIETIPNYDMIGMLPDPKPDGKLKDPEKIFDDLKEKRKEQIDKMALNPLHGRVCCFSVYGAFAQEFSVVGKISDADEAELIVEALQWFSVTKHGAPKIVTWNGHAFDIPFIYKRAMILGVKLPQGCYRMADMVKRYKRFPSCDLMQEFCAWAGRDYTSLNSASQAILGESKVDIDVTKFVNMILNGEQDKIGEYCLKDSKLLYYLFLKCAQYLF